MPSVKLKKGRDKSVLRKHPWIFSGAIDSVKDIKTNGETVEIVSFDGKLLGYGSYSLKSQIAVRVLSFDPGEKVTTDLFKRRIENAISLRLETIDSPSTNTYRIINSESDFIPGLIVDKYSDYLVCQFLSAGAEFWKKEIVGLLNSMLNPLCIYERSDVEVRSKEGLDEINGILSGTEPPDLLEVLENGYKFLVDIKNGHKTGFYIDQRDNRNILGRFSAGKEILNCFSYTGAFSVYAIKSGALKVINADASDEVLELAGRNLLLNNIADSCYENVREDVFHLLRKYRDQNQKFDLIILDPPKFAESASQIEKASRGYKDINLLAFKLLRKNGLLFTFSCSGHISQGLFGKIISDAALDSGREVQIIKYLTQSPDHTVTTTFPEGLYLKGFICMAL